jgi:hypothetical protein
MVQKTQQLPPEYVSTLGENFAQFFTGGLNINTSPFYVDPSKFTGDSFVAPQDTLTTDAQALAGGLGDYQKFLDQSKDITGIAQNMIIDPATGLVKPAAGAGALGQAQTAFDGMLGAATAGQGAGDQFLQAAQGFTGPQAYQQFMSPYQQEVIDTTLAQMDQDAAEQAAKLGASAGNAFGGGRFGVAQGQLAASNVLDRALTAAQLRQQGFSQANQLANQAFGQQMNMGSQAMNQASQNVGLFGQAGQAQAGLGQAQNQQLAQQFGQLGGLSAAQQQLGEYGSSMLGNQINALTQMGQQNQAFQQALLDAQQNQQQQVAFAPQQGLGFLSQMLGAAYGAPGGTTFQTTPQPSTLETLIGAGTGIVGILGATGAFDNDDN